MRLIGILLAVLIIGLLVAKQIGGGSSEPEINSTQSNTSSPVTKPRVPTKPNELQGFGSQVEGYLQQETEQRAREIEEAMER